MKLYFGRGKRKITTDFGAEDIYKFYKQKYKEQALSKSKFNDIWKRYINVRLQMVIFENVDFTMPFRMGEICIRIGRQANRITKNGKFQFTVDWGETKKKWENLYPDKTPEEIAKIPNKPLVYVLNENTDGKKVYWRWERITCSHKNYTVYRLKMNREWSKMLANYVKQLDKIPYYGTANKK